MNFKQQAKKLEHYLEEEFKKNIPLLVLNNHTVVYKNYKVKQNKNKTWDLKKSNGDLIDSFKLKATALLAAKFYDQNNFKKYNEVKILDSQYWSTFVDSSFLKQRYNTTKDYELKDLYYSRWDISNTASEYYKDKISEIFRRSF